MANSSIFEALLVILYANDLIFPWKIEPQDLRF